MAIQKPIRNQAPVPGRVSGQQTAQDALATSLLRSGRAATPAQAKELAGQILQGLKNAGFQIGLPNKLIGDLQAWAGLPKTGIMDAATLSFLGGLGLLQKVDGLQKGQFRSAASATADENQVTRFQGKDKPQWSSFKDSRAQEAPQLSLGKGVADLHKNEIRERQQRQEVQKNELSSLQGQLSQMGFPAEGRGNRALRAQVQQFQAAQGLPETGKLDQATLSALNEQGVEVAVQGRSAPDAQTDKEKATVPKKGIDQKNKGRGDEKEHGQGSQSDDDDDDAEGNDLGQDRDSELARAEYWGDSPAGEDGSPSSDEGHATLDDQSDADAGYYEVPSLRVQYVQALENIVASTPNQGPVRYSWDVTFHQPGVYGAYQPATPLWHIGIEEVSPFAEVWEEARQVLSEKFGALGEDQLPTKIDFEQALRRARVRIQDENESA